MTLFVFIKRKQKVHERYQGSSNVAEVCETLVRVEFSIVNHNVSNKA